MISEKEAYQFYFNEEVITFSDFQQRFERGEVTQEEFDTRYALMMEVVEANVGREREWRNHELLLTDRLMHADATYDGVVVRGSDWEQDITTYRQQLRDYDFRLSPRPVRPSWYWG
ncbi:hypothetical protein O1O06_10745 [Grimontia hollisae]|uniref:hypothetical protein n=1 Tax=Grimontia hollisae TaxID=673 RepID=UPI001303DC38|nr:hypothetical protein [Grimontia hollisae]MDF2185250.1 hypothetical protein [Grimontia hollisae]